jgi:nucleoside-diphosphate-sugar epimerase
MFMRVLMTGAAGTIGKRLAHALGSSHDLRLADLHRKPDNPNSVQLDVTDLAQAIAATRGIDAVIHLAIASGHEGDFEDDAQSATLRRQRKARGTY